MDSDNSFPEKPDFGRTWKKNLTMVWIAQFFSQIGFAFGLPFAPFYMQEMGVTRGNIDFWVALFGAGTPLTMMLFAPVWGALADKYGRRKMLLRSYLGGVLVLGLMGVVHAPVYLILLRLVQGALCGSGFRGSDSCRNAYAGGTQRFCARFPEQRGVFRRFDRRFHRRFRRGIFRIPDRFPHLRFSDADSVSAGFVRRT